MSLQEGDHVTVMRLGRARDAKVAMVEADGFYYTIPRTDGNRFGGEVEGFRLFTEEGQAWARGWDPTGETSRELRAAYNLTEGSSL